MLNFGFFLEIENICLHLSVSTRWENKTNQKHESFKIIECLVSERQKRKLSQGYIAERLGSTRITINAYEKGRRSVPIEFLVSWATLLKQEIKIQDIQTDHHLQLKVGAIS